jgi:hypothetical protein
MSPDAVQPTGDTAPEKPQPAPARKEPDGVVPPTAPPAPSAEAPAQERHPEPTPDDDFLRLESFDWRRAVVIRLNLGRHPDPVIEALLARRLNIPREEFMGPLVVRILCTLAFAFVGSAVAWVICWSAFSLLGLGVYLGTLSGLMMTLLAAMLGIAVFQPFRIYDEIGAVAKAQALFDELRSSVEEHRNLRRKPR